MLDKHYLFKPFKGRHSQFTVGKTEFQERLTGPGHTASNKWSYS